MNAYCTCLNPFLKIASYLTIMLWLLIVPGLDGIAASKRVAVLYFEDHSRFDSATGCGCIPNPFGLFGTGKGRTKWNLKEGFPELLNRKLKQTQVYEPISNEEVKDAMAQLGLSLKAVRSNAEKREQLAKALNVEAFIVGNIRKFNQERAKATRFQTLKGRGGGFNMAAGFVGGAQLIGYYYSATVHLKMKFYGSSGDEIAKRKIAATKRHQLGGAKFAALEAVVSEQGTELQLGQMPNPQKKPRPIVSYAKLNQIKFASPEYDLTLFGLATDDALTKVVLALRDTIGPEFIMPGTTVSQKGEGTSSPSSGESPGRLRAKVLYVNPDDPADAYINVGSSKGILVRQQLAVYTDGEPLIDPDTEEVLGNVPKMIGKVEVVEVKTDRLSRVRVIEGLGVIKKGDKVEETEPPLSGTQVQN